MRIHNLFITLFAILIVTAISAQKTYIPDDNFEQALIDLGYDSGEPDDSIPTANINSITTLKIHGKQIASLEGIQDFIALELLECSSNSLSSIDISSNLFLKELIIDDNNLTSIDLTNNKELTYLTCDNNFLSTLDVSNNTKLEILRCYHNNLSQLDVSFLTNLISLDCMTNKITNLNLQKNSSLQFLSCGANLLTELGLTKSPAHARNTGT